MLEADLFLLFVRPFNRVGIRYVITGSTAATFYGEPRLTNDVDFVILLTTADIEKLPEMFPSPSFYLPPMETIIGETQRSERGHFNIIHTDSGFKADLYPAGRDELNAWAFRMRHQIEFEGESMNLAPPEYVILRKLEYFREGGSDKHLRDIRSMLGVSGEQMDHAALNKWIQKRSLEAEWKLVSG
jgi:hypothetical protein